MTGFAAAFVALYAGHMVGDHVVQTDRQAANKAAKGWTGGLAMAGHLAGYGTAQAVAFALLVVSGVPLGVGAVLAGLVFSVATHAFIDRRWPVLCLLRVVGAPGFAALRSGGLNGAYLADQALHVGCLFVAALIIGGLS